MAGIRVTTLGMLHVERNGARVAELPAQPVRCALLLYLAVERAATRDELTALMWPERDAERARHSLSQTLYELRRTLGDDWLHASAERVMVLPDLTVDALDFEAAIERGRDDQALALYAGPFLNASHPGTTHEFESWVDRVRSRLQRQHRDACRRLIGAQLERDDAAAALAVARRWTELEPLEDEAQHRLIELLARTGRRAEALQRYAAYEELIARELEVAPLAETKDLVAGIRLSEERAAARRAQAGEEDERSAAVEAGVPPAAVAAEPAGHAGPGADGVTHAGDVPGSAPLARRRRRRSIPAFLATLVVVAAIYAVMVPPRRVDSARAAAAAAPAIAVLPFVNLSADPEQDYFSDGMTDDLITKLSRIEGLRVISRSSVMQYRTQRVSRASVAAELGVGYVVDGSVRREGNQLRINVQLSDAASGTNLWAETYDREQTGIFEIQNEITSRVAEALRRRFTDDDRERIASGGTYSVVAYDLFLKGMEYLNRAGAADVRKYPPAANFFRHALEIDPEYARAYVGLSTIFRVHVGVPMSVRRDSVLYYAQRAVDLEPDLPEALTALGSAFLIRGELTQAEEAFRRALALDPGQAGALSGLARRVWLDGRFDEAVRWARRALAVDPVSATRLVHLGDFLYDLGDLDGAEAAYAQALEFAPDFPQPAYLLATINLIRGEQERAEERMRALLATASDHPGTRLLLGRYYAQLGRYAEAEANLRMAADAVDASGASHYLAFVAQKSGDARTATALTHAAQERLTEWERDGIPATRLRLYIQALTGDHDGALATLTRHMKTGLREITSGPQVGVYWIDTDPLLDGLRDEPRFQALLAELRVSLDSMRAALAEAPPRLR